MREFRSRFRPGPRSAGIPAAAFPGRVATNADLIVAVDRQQTTLLLPLSAGGAAMTVLDPSMIVAYSLLSIDNEIVKVTGPPAGNVIPVSRGFDGTTPASHLANAPVSGLVDAYHHNALAAEIEAIETFMGPNGANLLTTSGDAIYSKTYDFVAQQPGGTLVPGNNSITLAPVPLGVNGTDTQHYLYISGGTGTAEAVLITGGTGVSGSPSGQIIVNCANGHSGAWTIKSASAGVKEACNVLNNVGTVNLPRATMNIYAPVVVPTTINLLGQGTSNVGGQTGSIFNWLGGAKPCFIFASGVGDSMSNQLGMGIYRDFTAFSPNNTGDGMWIGGDISGVITPAAWQGDYTNFEYVRVINFTNALVYNVANFVTFINSVFSGLSRALLIPAAGAGGLQYTNFTGCVLTVPSGFSVQMDQSGLGSGYISYVGGQVSGTMTGTTLHWHSFGTHYESNDTGSAVVNITGNSAVFFAYGGLMGTHNIALRDKSTLLFDAGSGVCWVILNGVEFSETDPTPPDPAVWVNGAVNLSIKDIQYFPFNWTAHIYGFGVNPSAGGLDITQNRLSNITLNAAATLAFPLGNMNYPDSGITVVNGSTLGGGGITAVSGLLAGQFGVLVTALPQTFTAGASIGNTITTTAALPYSYWFDGSKIYIR